MTDFVNREMEIQQLHRLSADSKAHFVMVYGRRRIGKTTLLTHWASRSGLPMFYWVAKRETAKMLMANLAQHIWAWEHGIDRADLEIRPNDWEAVLLLLSKAIAKRKCIVILDELPYLLESDPAFPSYLQAAWDHHFKNMPVKFLVSGSHVGMMTRLVQHEAPLYGRFTAQMPIQPLSFPDLAHFLPGYDVHKRLAVFSILGGIPAYLERWQSYRSLIFNIERLFLQRTGWFRNEPLVLISDLTQREKESYESILRAMALGKHGRDEISHLANIPTTSLSHYLPRLLDLGLVERRIPATIPLDKRHASRESRYFLSDPYLKFYYRFIDPNLHLIEQGLSHRLWTSLEGQFRAFVADTFENLCRQWVIFQAQRGKLPMEPEIVGSHWSANAQVDVVAINWKSKDILLGEAKWGQGKVGQEVVRELIDKTTKIVPDGGRGWKIHTIFFAREQFTQAARSATRELGGAVITLKEMEPALRSVPSR